jgi:RNA ligase (TIGR02306 family)
VSTHKVEVIRIADIERHPNADRLGIVRVYGFTAIVALGEYKPGDLAVYIEPDYVVPDTEHFAFLQGKTRIRAKKLRGVWSQGLLIKAPEGVAEGDCVMERLGITRYEPQMQLPRGRVVSSWAESPHETLSCIGSYDLENWRRHRSHFSPGERVIATEKIHGANARYAFRDGRMWVGSRTQWKKESEADTWWRALRAHPWIEEFCRANPSAVLYGEVFGSVQDLKYGATADEVFFRAFDILDGGRWMDACDFIAALPAEHRAPVVFDGPYDQAALEELSRGDSVLAKHLSEGIVIKPERERWEPRLGRVALKLVSDRYLERAA